MFQGIQNVSGLDSRENQLQDVADKLPNLGVAVNQNEKVIIYKRSDTFYTQHTTLTLNNDSTRAAITYNFAPNVISWVLGVCFFPLGFLIFIVANNAKSDFENSVALLWGIEIVGSADRMRDRPKCGRIADPSLLSYRKALQFALSVLRTD